MMTRIALLLLVASLYWTCTGSQQALDCCLSVTDRPLPRGRALSYRLADAGCNVKATVFITIRGKTVCAPAPEDSHWVRALITKMDKKRA